MKMSKILQKRIAVLLVIVIAFMSLVGCYGQFPLTRVVYDINGSITDSGIIHTIVFWIFVIFPVYEISMLVDAIVLNLIEFWTDEAIDLSMTTDQKGKMIKLASSCDSKEAVLTISQQGIVKKEIRFIKVSEGVCEIRDSEHRLLGSVLTSSEGDLSFVGRNGLVLHTIPAEKITAMKNNSSGQ